LQVFRRTVLNSTAKPETPSPPGYISTWVNGLPVGLCVRFGHQNLWSWVHQKPPETQMLAYTDLKTDDGLLHLGDGKNAPLYNVAGQVTAGRLPKDENNLQTVQLVDRSWLALVWVQGHFGQSPTFSPVLGCCYSVSSSNRPLARVAKSDCNRPDPLCKAARIDGGFVSCTDNLVGEKRHKSVRLQKKGEANRSASSV